MCNPDFPLLSARPNLKVIGAGGPVGTTLGKVTLDLLIEPVKSWWVFWPTRAHAPLWYRW